MDTHTHTCVGTELAFEIGQKVAINQYNKVMRVP
jgi:hypothetical protein